jgi:hypothetical protein
MATDPNNPNPMPKPGSDPNQPTQPVPCVHFLGRKAVKTDTRTLKLAQIGRAHV